MSLEVVESRPLEDAYCTHCQETVYVDDSHECPDCGRMVHPLSLARVPAPDGPTTTTTVLMPMVDDAQPRPIKTQTRTIATVAPPTKPVSRQAVLPSIPASTAWEAATNALLAELERDVQRASETTAAAQAALDAAQVRQRLAQRALADMRQLRGLVRVSDEPPPTPAPTPAVARPWSREHPACRECGTTERKHTARGYCTRCYSRWNEGALNPEAPE